MDKNDKEKQLISEWCAKNISAYNFQTIDKSKKSYFIQRESNAAENLYIREYGFETLPELIKELDALWEDNKVMDSVKRVAGIAALKNKPSMEIQNTIAEEDKKGIEDKLPAFIYNF